MIVLFIYLQIANIPGITEVTDKSQLMKRNLPFMPKSFHIPEDIQKFKLYVRCINELG